MKKHAILFALILIFASAAFAQDKIKKPVKTETPKPAAEKVKLPTAKEIFDNYIKSSGGRAAIEKVKSRSMIGTVELPAMGLKGNFEIISKSPNKSLANVNLSGFGEIIEAFDGNEAWSKNPLQGQRVKTGAELDEVKKSSDFYYDLNLDKIYPKAIVTGVEKQGTAEVYVVKADDDATFYFDKQTGLMTRIDRTVTSPQGKVSSVTTFEDYRDAGGVKQAYKFTQSAVGADFVFTVSEIKQNVEIADERFSKPK